MKTAEQHRMKRLIGLVLILVLIPFYLIPRMAYSWGFYAHRNINREAVLALPEPLGDFYKKNIDYITLHATDPDKRRYVDSTEAPHHFIDLDHYGSKSFDKIPHYWSAAVDMYSADTLQKYGTLPWATLEWENKLMLAFKKKDVTEILRASSYLGHYVADAHVPLHTIANYNGQKTEQQGIHALWETAIPQTYGNDYNYNNCKAVYIKNPEEEIWNILRQSYALAPATLKAEKAARSAFMGKDIYLDSQHKKFLPGYIETFNKDLNGMVEKQMRASISDVASFWYTAWVNAGQPDITKIKVQ